MSERSVFAQNWIGISEDELKTREADAFADGRRAGLEQAAGVLREWAGHYPTDIFPENGKTVDAQSAKFARHLCCEIEIDIRALASEPETDTAVQGYTP